MTSLSPNELLEKPGVLRSYTDGVKINDSWSVEDEFERASEIVMIPIEMIAMNPDNPRRGDLGAENSRINGTSEAEIEAFAVGLRSARARGVGLHGTGIHTPLIVRRDNARTDGRVRYTLVEGECRYRASLINGLSSLPCEIRDMNKREAFLSAIEIGIGRKDWSPLEEALALRAFMNETGYGIRKAATHLRRTKREVENRLGLLKLQPDAQELLTYHSSSMTLVLEINKIKDPVIRREAIALGKEGVTRDQIQELVRQRTQAKAPLPASIQKEEKQSDKKLKAAFPTKAPAARVAFTTKPARKVLLPLDVGLCLSSAASQVSKLNDAMMAYDGQTVPDNVRNKIDQGLKTLQEEMETLRKFIDGSKLSE